jgi:hypothetical protein
MRTNESFQATQHIRVLGSRSHTHLMLCANNLLYVVKPLDTPDKPRDKPRRRQLLAGFLANRLARLVGLPVSEPAIVEISSFVSRTTPQLEQDATLCATAAASFHPATRYAGDLNGKKVFDMLPGSCLTSLGNLNSFAHLLALDQWSSHLGSPKVVFHRSSNSLNYSMEIINRSRSFSGSELSFHDHPQNGVYNFKAVYRHLSGWDSFEPFLTSLILTSPEALWQLTRNLPFGWSEDYARDLDALVESLLRRRSLIRQLIARSRDQIPDLFPHWTRRAFVPTQGSWLQAPRALGAQEVFPIKNTAQPN